MEYVITVNEQDVPTGTEEKLAAHKKGTLHRAFSVFIFNDRQELLLQQRAAGKYHSGSLWTNTCCSHPAPGEDTTAAAHRRLVEEMGFDCPITYVRPFRYRAEVDHELIENEIDHLYTGIYNGPVQLTPREAQDCRYLPLLEIRAWMEERPQDFTAWFRMILPDLM